jgi:uncharacterized protein YeaO (DUF488 family)
MDEWNSLKVKRVYSSAEEADGYRILIDRLWPRGISKAKAMIDEWNKTIAPSTELRKWFAHKEENYAVFANEYRKELDASSNAALFAKHVGKILTQSPVTLLYGAKSESCNHAIILRDWILNFSHSTKQPER